jgi:hypothetical protein
MKIGGIFMPTEKHVINFVINKVPTKSIFEKMKTQGLINDDEIYLVEEDDSANYLQLSGGTMTGALTTKGIKLTSGTDYGNTLPSSPDTNQLFFHTVGTNFVLDNVYPVGSIYMNVNSTNPRTLFGGTWEQIQGKFLLGMSISYPAGSQGGEASHTLTTDEMPSHGHNPANQSGYYGFITNSQKAFAVGDMGVQSGSGRYYPYAPVAFDISRNSLTGATGGGSSHNNMPPYLSIYIWKRTA